MDDLPPAQKFLLILLSALIGWVIVILIALALQALWRLIT